jgi:hypothetical protein
MTSSIKITRMPAGRAIDATDAAAINALNLECFVHVWECA